MTDVIDTESMAAEPAAERLFGRRTSVDSAGRHGTTWPDAERRVGPRRLDDLLSPDRRERLESLPVSVAAPVEGHTGPKVRDRHVHGYRKAVMGIDALAAALGASLAYGVRFGGVEDSSSEAYRWGSLMLPVLWVAAIATCRVYESRFLASSSEEYRRVIHAGLGVTTLISTVSYVFRAEFARGYVVLALPLTLFLALVGRYWARRVLRHIRRSGRCMQDVLVVGHEWAVLDMVAELRRDSLDGLRVVAACLPGGRGSRQMDRIGVPVIGDLTQVVEAVAAVKADVLAVTTCVEFGGPELRHVCWALEQTDVEVLVAPALIEVAGPRLHIRPVAGLPLLHVERPEFTGVRRVVKGVFDRVIALAILALLAPVLVVLVAGVKLTSRGPALYKQTRVGVGGRPFTIYKFRSMQVDADAHTTTLRHLNANKDGLLFKVKRDPRITPFGKILRRYSLDELPQMINVVKGDMSLVGPRPPLPSEVEHYAGDVNRRLLVKPGVTGLWQVSGRSNLTWEESVRLDLRYVENWSLVLDFSILWKTGHAVLRGSGAY